MNALYLMLNVGAISIPLAYSFFEKDWHFIQHARKVFLSISFVAAFFLIWDVFFTSFGVWGFNPDYYLGFKVLKMPIEEWLFFICIPYACIFSHEALKHYIPKWGIPIKASQYLSYLLLAIAAILVLTYYDRWYTALNYSVFIVVLTIALWKFPKELAKFYPSFMLILIPFCLTNGILTGSFIDNEVVWYNNAENLGIRMGTIPVEDAAYAFSMIFGAQMIFTTLKSKK